MNTPRINRSFISAAAALALSGQLYSVTVNTLTDERDTCASGGCSLWEAVNETATGGTVDFSVSLPGTITLSSGSVPINKNIRINGPLSNDLNISGSSGIFSITAGDVNISNLTLTGANYADAVSISSGVSLRLNECDIANNSYSYLVNNIGGQVTIVKTGISNNIGSSIVNSGTLSIDGSTVVNNSGSGSAGSGPIYSSSGSVTISNSRLEGNSGSSGGAVRNVGASSLTIVDSNMSGNTSSFEGGAVNNSGTLNITGSRFTGNTSSSNGAGAVYHSTGTMTITGSTFENNRVNSGPGGAIYHSFGITHISQTTISDNNATGFGGGIYIDAASAASTVDIIQSSILRNNASHGGGIKISTYGLPINVNIQNSTISENNVTTSGGGVYVYDGYSATDVNISHSTIANNYAAVSAGGIGNDSGNPGNTIKFKSSLIVNNTAPIGPDCNATTAFNSYGYNLLSTNAGCPVTLISGTADLINASPGILALADNGGLTWTHALDTASPARKAGSYYAIDGVTPVITDQRGFVRPPTLPSIGAFEPQPAGISISSTSHDFGSVYIGTTSAAYTLTVTNIGEDPLTIDSISMAGSTAEFGWTSSCGSAMTTGVSCTIDVTFAPLDALPYIDSLVIADITAGLSVPVTLTGSGSEVPVSTISVDPTFVNFGYVEANTTASQSITVTNSGSADLTISDISLYGGISEFSLSNTCSSPIAPAGSCTITVSFTPSGESAYGDMIVITSNAGNILTPIALAGYGSIYYSGYKIDFGSDITKTEYTAAVALDPAPLADINLFELRVDSHDGLRTSMIDMISGSPNRLNFYDFNLSALKYSDLGEENNFTIGSDNVMNFSDKFLVKYTGSMNAYDLNSTLFGPNGKAYEFVYLQLVDEYRFDQEERDYQTSATYASLDAYMTAHDTDSNTYFMQRDGSYNVGLVFAYTAGSGATSGNLMEWDTSTRTLSASAVGTWEIKTVSGVGDDGKVLLIHPADTTNYYKDEMFAMRNGVVWRGELQAADSAFKFYWFDQTAHNEFVTYFGGVLASTGVTGTITLPSTFANDVIVNIFIDIDNHDRIEKSYTIAAGTTSTTFSLEVPDGTEKFRVGYAIYDSVSGLLQRGYLDRKSVV